MSLATSTILPITDVTISDIVLPEGSDYLSGFAIVDVSGATTLTVGESQYVGSLKSALSLFTDQTTATSSVLYDRLTNYFGASPGVGCYVFYAGPTGSTSDDQTAIGQLATWYGDNYNSVTGGSAWWSVSLPQEWYASSAEDSTSALKGLLKPYSGDGYMPIWIVPTLSADGSSDPNIDAVTGLADAVLVYSPASSAYQGDALLGSIASIYYGTSPQTSPNLALYKAPTATAPDLTQSQKSELNAANVVWSGTINTTTGAQVWQGGRTQSGILIQNKYAANVVKLLVQTALDDMIILRNQAGNPVLYNEAGIRELAARIRQELGALARSGIITQVAYQPATSVSAAVAASPSVSYVPYAQYVTANPSDVAAGIYDGFTLSVQCNYYFTSLTIRGNFMMQ